MWLLPCPGPKSFGLVQNNLSQSKWLPRRMILTFDFSQPGMKGPEGRTKGWLKPNYFKKQISSSSLLKFRFSEKATKIWLRVLTLISNVKTLRTIVPNFCGLLRISDLYLPKVIIQLQNDNGVLNRLLQCLLCTLGQFGPLLFITLGK